MPSLDYLPEGSKEVRAHAVTPFIDNGRMLLPESADFLADFLDEHAKFPAGKYDDMVDTTSMAGLILARAGISDMSVAMGEKVSQW